MKLNQKYNFLWLLIAFISFVSISSDCIAGEADRAARDSAQASRHSANAALHAIIGTGKVISGAVAIPLTMSAAAGRVSGESANILWKAVNQPIGTPLEISEESVSIGTPPDRALQPSTSPKAEGKTL